MNFNPKKFNKERHNSIYTSNGWEHGPDCLCKKQEGDRLDLLGKRTYPVADTEPVEEPRKQFGQQIV